MRNKTCIKCDLGKKINITNRCLMNEQLSQKDILFIVPNPTYNDEYSGEPFKDSVYSILHQILSSFKYTNYHLSYALKCFNKGAKPINRDYKDCFSEYLYNEIIQVSPKIIVFLGKIDLDPYPFTNFGIVQDSSLLLFEHKYLYTHNLHESDKIINIAEHIHLALNSCSNENIIENVSYKILSKDNILEFIEDCQKSKLVSFNVLTKDYTHVKVLNTENVIYNISFSFQPGSSFVLPINHPSQDYDYLSLLKIIETQIFSNNKIIKLSQNTKFHLHWLRFYGIFKFAGKYYDTMLLNHLLNNRDKHSLKELVKKYLPLNIDYDRFYKKHSTRTVPLDISLDYSARVSDIVYRLFIIMIDNVMNKSNLFEATEKIFRPLTMRLYEAENFGININYPKLNQITIPNFIKELEVIKNEIYNIDTIIQFNKNINDIYYKNLISSNKEYEKKFKTGELVKKELELINFNDEKQMLDLIYKSPYGYKCKVIKDNFGKELYSTKKDVLNKLDIDIKFKELLLKYRSLKNLVDVATNYKDFCYKYIKVHPNFFQTGHPNYRITSNNPNTMNIPTRSEQTKSYINNFKECFICPDGYSLLILDYNQIELRILALLSQDEALINDFNNDIDLHQKTADRIKGSRELGKEINFSIIYDVSAETLSFKTGITIEEANEYINNFYISYPKVKEFKQRCIDEVNGKGYFETFLGVYVYPDTENKRSIFNSVISTCASFIPQIAIVENYYKFNNNIEFINTIYDSIWYYVDNNSIELLKEEIKNNSENINISKYLGFEQNVIFKTKVEIFEKNM